MPRARILTAPRKIEAIKVVRQVAGIGLREAKQAVEQREWFDLRDPLRGPELLAAAAGGAFTFELEDGESEDLPTETPAGEWARIVSTTRKIHAIKIVREVSGVGLLEAKNAVEQGLRFRLRPNSRALDTLAAAEAEGILRYEVDGLDGAATPTSESGRIVEDDDEFDF